MNGKQDAFRAGPTWRDERDLEDAILRLQLQELSRSPVPGRLRAADILEVRG